MGILSVLKGLSIVLPVLISIMGSMVLLGAAYNFTAQKACSPEGIPEDINRFICGDVTILDEVNDITTTTASIKSACAALGSSLFGFIRDVSGKSKPLLFIGAAAELITAISYFVCTLYWSSTPWVPAMVQAIVGGLCGELIMQLGTTCLIIQHSTPEELPMRLQFYLTMNMFLILIGGTLSTMILTNFGYRWLFTVAMGLQIIAILLVIIFVKEKENVSKNFKESVQSLKNIFKWRENVIVLWLMLFAAPLSVSILTAESANSSSFYQMKFKFSMYQTSAYSAYSFMIAIIGSMVVPLILRNVLHFGHLTIGIIASAFSIVSPIAMAFVETTLGLYLIALLNFTRLVILPLPNTVISEIVNNNEMGTYFGIAAVLTLWVPYSITKVYRIVFHNYENTWIGAYFFVSSVFFFVLTIIFSISYCLYNENKKTDELTESKENLDQNVEVGKSSLQDRNGI